MNFEELLNGYLDGALSGGDQAELFHFMSVSPEKRMEFNESLAVRRMAVEDRLALEPPAGVADNVRLFAAAYGADGANNLVGATAVSSTGRFAALIRGAVPYAVAAGVLVCGIIIGYYFGSMRGGAAQNSPAPVSGIVTSTPPNISVSQQPLPQAVVSGSGSTNTTNSSNITKGVGVVPRSEGVTSASMPTHAAPFSAQLPERGVTTTIEQPGAQSPAAMNRPAITKIEWTGGYAAPPTMQTVISLQGNEPLRRFREGVCGRR